MTTQKTVSLIVRYMALLYSIRNFLFGDLATVSMTERPLRATIPPRFATTLSLLTVEPMTMTKTGEL